MDFHRPISVEKQKQNDLRDIIELKDGTRIKSQILQISNDEISYFNVRNEQTESINATAISKLHLEKASVCIPFPLNPPTPELKQSKVQNQIDQVFLQHKFTL